MDNQNALFAIILAAGKGTRMKSDLAKVLHQVFFAPMIHHVVEAVQRIQPLVTVVIVGHQRDAVIASLSGYNLRFAIQESQRGTGHAVLCAKSMLGRESGVVMILCGDTPLLDSQTLAAMYQEHVRKGPSLTIMTTVLEDPTHYGRIITDGRGRVEAIVEEKDASPEQRLIKEINAGIYCVNSEFLFDALARVGTDIVSIAVASGHIVETFVNTTPQDVLGVNSRVELAQAHKALQLRRNIQLMLQGVTMHDPETTAVAQSATINRDTILEAGVRITGISSVGSSCRIGTGSLLEDCVVEEACTIGPYCFLHGVHLHPGAVIAPHTVIQTG